MIDKKYQIGVPIVNPEEKMMPSAPAIREYVSGIHGGRPVGIGLHDEFYFNSKATELYNTGKLTIPAGTPVYRIYSDVGNAIVYSAGNLNFKEDSLMYTNEFSTENFVGVLTDDFVLEAKDFVQKQGYLLAFIPASIMTVGSVNIKATGIEASWFAKLLAAPYQGIKFESDEVVNNQLPGE